MHNKTITSRESLYLDIIKALLLFEVILGHAVALSAPRFSELDLAMPNGLVLAVIKSISGFGRESAFLFIFLSGFFCAKEVFPYGKKFRLLAAINWRIRRLYPVFLFALFMTLAIDYLGFFLLQFPIYQKNGLNYDLIHHWGFNIFIANLFSIQPTFSVTFGTNGPLWTLGYLIQFFIIAVGIRFCSGDSIGRFILFSIIIAFALVPVSGWEPSLLFMVWCFGVCSWYFSLQIPHWVKLRWIFISTFALLLVARVSPPYLSIFMTPIIGCGVLTQCRKVAIDLPHFVSVSVNKMAIVNYAAYAVHMPILFFVAGIFGFNIQPGISTSLAIVFIYFFVTLFLVYIFSLITQKIVHRITHVSVVR